ncbi:autotransporter domain-containing esterase [Nostoc sp. 3335mG]|nr:autotransporter domain-containing esterase [Nostoc sp. 3335mG]
MSLGSRRLAAGLLFATMLTAPAGAQRFDRVVAFGDSYADIGNVRAILDGAGLSALFPSTEYPTGRFSGGTNFVDTIADAYGIPDENYAIGGAQAGTGNVAAQGLLPGFQQQWVAFTQGGTNYTDTGVTIPVYVSGVATPIPAGGLQFRADDLVVFSVGGNDARPYRRNGTLAGAPAAADAAAAQATVGLDALVARGLKHMVFTVGDVGQLAEAVGQANAPVGTAFSTEYNAKMQAVLARYAAAGVQVAYVDITQVANVVKANPARFGFIDTTSACPIACETDPALQSRYFFYDDGVHLTSNAFALVGEYSVNQINAPYGLRADGDLPLLEAQRFGQDLGNRADLARGSTARSGLSLFGDFEAAHRNRDADDTADGYDYNSRGGIAGLEYRFAGFTAGLAGSYARGRIDGDQGDRIRGRSYQVGAYAAGSIGPLFAQAYLGYGWHRVAIRRTGVADPLTADPHAKSVVAGGRVGWLAGLGPLSFGPVAGLDYARARLAGYTEASDPAASLVVGHQTIDTLTGSAGIEARASALGRVAPWLRLTVDKPIDGDGRTLSYAPAIAPTIVNSFAIGSSSKRVYGLIEGGASIALVHGLSLQFNGRADLGRKQGDGVSGLVGLSAGF